MRRYANTSLLSLAILAALSAPVLAQEVAAEEEAERRALGGLAGVLVTPITTLSYDVGVLLGLKGFAAAILGGPLFVVLVRSRRMASL